LAASITTSIGGGFIERAFHHGFSRAADPAEMVHGVMATMAGGGGISGRTLNLATCFKVAEKSPCLTNLAVAISRIYQ
jgi:hypothetical protein